MKKQIIGAVAGYVMLLLLLLILLLFCPTVWVLGGALLLAVIPMVSLLLNLYVRRGIHVSLQLPATAAKNAAVTGKAVFRNDAWLPAARLYCVLGVINDLTGETEEIFVTSGIGARQTTEQSFLMQSAYCGRLYFYVKKLYLTDYFGMIPLCVREKASARITVLPELFASETGERLFSAAAEEGYANRKGDDPTEVFQLREYQRGDDVRRIHWKLSSKLDTLILKEAGFPQSKSRLVFWDKRVLGTPAQMDALADSVASICNALLESGEQFRIGYPERDELREWDVTDENTLLQAIPALAKCAASPDCPDPNLEGYGSVLYFSAAYSAELAADEHVIQMICAEQETEEEGAVVFTPENYRERLQRLEL